MTSPISRKPSPNPTSDAGLTDQELTTAFRLKENVDEFISSMLTKLMEIDRVIIKRNSLKIGSKKEKMKSELFGETSSVNKMYTLYHEFLDISLKPGVRTILEIYASMAKPKHMTQKLTATVQAHSSEMVRTTLRNNNVLTLSLSGRPGESGLMDLAPNLKTNKEIISGELPRNMYTWKMVVLKNLEYLSSYAPAAVHNYVEQIAKAHKPKIYGIDFWWSWYIHGFSLYANPTKDVKDAMYDEYTDLIMKVMKVSPIDFADVAKMNHMREKCYTSTDKAANLYKLSRFLREAWASVGITFPGGGFNITHADHDHKHVLQPNMDEEPELCPVYGVSVAQTTNADDFDFTNKGLPFLIHSTDDSVSAQAYRNAPHLADGANFAPLRTKMEENVKATYVERCNSNGPNINMLDQQLYWLKKIIDFCKDPNQKVYYAYVYLSMVVKRSTTHSAMINMFQHGMGYAFTCLDPSCRWIPNLEQRKIARAAMQASEYLKDIKIIEQIVKVPQEQSQLCHYVERTYNEGGIFVAGDHELMEEDRAILDTVKRYEEIIESGGDLDEIMGIIEGIFDITDRSPQYIESRFKIFERIKKIFAELNKKRRSPIAELNKKRRLSPSLTAGGKRSSTRKRMAPIRRIRTRKNKRRIRYTKKNKK